MKTPLLFLCALSLSAAVVAAQESAPAKPAAAPAASQPAAPVQHVTPAELEPLLAQKKVVVLDIRTPEEFAAGHIAGAKNIDFLDAGFKEKVAALDKSQSYVVHCAAGGRSTKSLPVFADGKFPSILHLDGGFKAWSAAGKPVEK